MNNKFLSQIQNNNGSMLVQVILFSAITAITFMVIGQIKLQKIEQEKSLQGKMAQRAFEDFLLFDLSNEKRCTCYFKDKIKDLDTSSKEPLKIDKDSLFTNLDCSSADQIDNSESIKKSAYSSMIKQLQQKSNLNAIELSSFSGDGANITSELKLSYEHGKSNRALQSKYQLLLEIDSSTKELQSCRIATTLTITTEEIDGSYSHVTYTEGTDNFDKDRMCAASGNLSPANREGDTAVPISNDNSLPLNHEGELLYDNGGKLESRTPMENILIPGDKLNSRLPITISSSAPLTGKLAEYYIPAEEYFANTSQYLTLRDFDSATGYSGVDNTQYFDGQTGANQLISNPPLLPKNSGIYIGALRKVQISSSKIELYSNASNQLLATNNVLRPHYMVTDLKFNDFKDVNISDGSLFLAPGATQTTTWECKPRYNGSDETVWVGETNRTPLQQCYNGQWLYAGTTGKESIKGESCTP